MNIKYQKITYILALCVIIIGTGLFLFSFLPHFIDSPTAKPIDNLTIASGSPEYSLLTLIAAENGYFRDHNLNVTLIFHSTGVKAVETLLMDNADLAYAAEYVGVNLLFSNPNLKIIGTTAKSDVISLVIRSDRGIVTPNDLNGKIIAVPKGTQAEFFLGRYLTLNGLNQSDITIRYIPPSDLVENISSGNVDAAIIWEPYVYSIQKKLGHQQITWSAQSGQQFYWVTYTLPDIIIQKSDILTRYFQALSDAEHYIITSNEEALREIKENLNLSDDYLDTIWKKNQFTSTLDQSLIIAMEDEARWMMKNNLTQTQTMPVYLNTIDCGILQSVKPASVNIITEDGNA
jgi:NitT/TauT family transport system substrate-binding protein